MRHLRGVCWGIGMGSTYALNGPRPDPQFGGG
jgi:hypothetical protein